MPKPETHPDAATVAARVAQLPHLSMEQLWSLWDDHFDELPVHTISAQLYFRLAFEPQTLAGFPSHFTVDISDTLETKVASIQCYETQFPPEKAYVFDRIRGAAMLAGAASGFQAGEVFVSARPIGTTDLMKTALPLH